MTRSRRFPGRSSASASIRRQPMGDSTGRILAALQLAAEKHRDQRRKDLEASPYINHPIALASVLWAEGGVRDAAGLCAALVPGTNRGPQTPRGELRPRAR